MFRPTVKFVFAIIGIGPENSFRPYQRVPVNFENLRP